MNWSHYIYLAPVLVLSALALLLVVRKTPDLTKPSERRTRTELLVLGCVLALGVATVYWSFFAGVNFYAYNDLGTDTKEQYVPFYLNLLDSVRDGTLSLWNLDFGLGTSFMSYQSWLFDPFNLVLIPLGLLLGNNRLSLALVIVQTLKIVLSGYLFDRLLTRYCETPLARILGSSVFAFGGFLLLWGQHYWLGTAYVTCVALIVLLELLMERWTAPRFAGVALGVGATIVMSTYSGFLILIFAAAYTLLRLAHGDECRSVGTYFRRLLPIVLAVLCGCMIGAVALIPYAQQLLTESSRVTSSQAPLSSRLAGYLTGFVPLQWVPLILSRLLGNGLVASGLVYPDGLVPQCAAFPYLNSYEFIMMGFSGASLILLAQFAHWAAKEADGKDRALIVVGAVLCLLYCFNFLLPAISNLLVEPKYRGSFALAIPVCVAMSVGWEKRVLPGKVSKGALVAGGGLTLAVIAWSLVKTVNGRLECLFYLVATCLLIVVLALPEKRRVPATLGICFALVTSMSIADAFFTVNNRGICSSGDFPEAERSADTQDTYDALAYLREQDGSFYRVEKTYSDYTRLNDSLIEGYMTVSSYNSTLDSDVSEFYERLWPGAVASTDACQIFFDDPDHPELASLLDVKYILSRDPLPLSWCSLMTQIGSVYVYRTNATSIATVSANVVSETDANSLADDQARRALLADSVIVPDDQATGLSTVGGASSQTGQSSSSFTRSGAASLSGTVDAAQDSVVCLAIPHTSGWKVTVDGEEVPTFRADYGFIGFEVTQGTHEVSATFELPGLGRGMLVAAAGVVAIIVVSVLHKRLGNRKAPAAHAA